jgi:hypothetical protein
MIPARGARLASLLGLVALATLGLPAAARREDSPMDVLAAGEKLGAELGLTPAEVAEQMSQLIDGHGPMTIVEIQTRVRRYAASDERRARKHAETSAMSIADWREVIARRRRMRRPVDGPWTIEDTLAAEYLFAREERTRQMAEIKAHINADPASTFVDYNVIKPPTRTGFTRASHPIFPRHTPAEDQAALRASVLEEAKKRSERLAEVKLERKRQREERKGDK